MRAYTIREIDEIRYKIRNEYLFGRYSSVSGVSRTYNHNDLTFYVEQRTRTIMEAGLTADDLKDLYDT